jgi:putative peptidoglycan lipid II flippase
VSLFKSASTVSLLTLASRITGLARETLMAAAFGASPLTDAFYVAFRIPNLFRRVLGEGAFTQAFVPTLAACKAQQGDDAAKLLIDRVATVLTWVLVLTCLAGVLGAPLMVWAMASGLQQDAKGYEAAVVMSRWLFPYIGFMSLVALGAGVLNTWRRFAVAAATPVLLNLAMIAAVWLGVPWFRSLGIEPIYAMVGGVMVGGVLQLVAQVPSLLKLGLLPRIGLSWNALRQAWADPTTRNVAALMLPAMLGVSVAQISLLINTQIATHLALGSVTYLTYSDRLMEFPTALLGVALGVVLMPQLAGAKAAGDGQKYSDLLDIALRFVVFLALPCAVALMTFAEPLVAVLLNYGAFKADDVHQTALAVQGWSLGLVGIVAIKVLAPGYFANHDMKTPAKIAVVVLVVTQVLNYFLVPHFRHAALTMSIGIGALVNAGWLLVGLVRHGGYKPLPGWGLFLLQVVAASALLAVFLMWANAAFPWTAMHAEAAGRIGLLAMVLLGSAVIYFGAALAAGLKWKQFLRH